MSSARFLTRVVTGAVMIVVGVSGCRDEVAVVGPATQTEAAASVTPVAAVSSTRDETNHQSVESDGERNVQTVAQSGTGNSQEAVATGNGNVQDLEQDGNENTQSARANGDGNTQAPTQSGEGNQQTAVAEGDDNSQTSSQDGSGNTQSATTDGDGNDQHATQGGESNMMAGEQHGTALRIRSEQDGRRNIMLLRQYGANLELVSLQAGDGGSVVVRQDGEDNRLSVRGDLLSDDDDVPLLIYDQPPVQEPSTAEVVWKDPRLQITDGEHNALRIHYGDRSELAEGHQTVMLTASTGAIRMVTIPLDELPAHGSQLIRYSDFTHVDAATASPRTSSDMSSFGMRVVSSEAVMNVLSIEAVRVIDARIAINSPVNLNARGVLRVALFGSSDLDVTGIDPASLELFGMPLRSNQRRQGPTWMISFEDIDDDGFDDAILHFDQADWSPTPQVLERDAALTGMLSDGSLLAGTSVEPIRFTGGHSQSR